jgi:hypothetical protein
MFEVVGRIEKLDATIAQLERHLQMARETREELITMTTREGAISILMSIDPNGTWSDEDCIAEGLEPLTLAEALEMIRELESEE